MMLKKCLMLLLIALAGSGWAMADAPYKWERLEGTETLKRPVYLTHAGDDRLFIVEQHGVISIFAAGELLPEPFLDIEALVDSSGNEEGLLSVAFDPNYAENGYFYVNYTADDETTRIVRYNVSADPNVADPDSAEYVIVIDQPYSNHNGGLVKFGPDGYLYIGMGDGGAGGDPDNRAQNPNDLLGKMLRLDVSELPYAIPEDNPFADGEEARPEIWALGLRNPWRFSFDRATGDLYIGDVGQGWIEELNFQSAESVGGENYGWNVYEGSDDYEGGSLEEAIFPIAEYDHNESDCSVTGGYVYRGENLPDLVGTYLYGDFCTGRMWSLTRAGDNWVNEDWMETGLMLSSFGEDVNGELYALSFNPAGVYQLVGE